jgi:tetratricopeptide (TPR) repeat protein
MPKLRAQEIEDAEAFGQRLRDARRRAQLTQRELSFPGCTAAYVSRMESGSRVPSLEIVRQLATRLGVSEGFLLGRGVDPDAHPSQRDLRAELELRLGRFEEAKAAFEEALREPLPLERRAEMLVGLGRIALGAGEPQRAVELFEKAAAEAEVDAADQPSLAEHLARAYAATGAVSAAIALLDRSIAEDPDAPAGLLLRLQALLGGLLMDVGDTAAATEALEAAADRRHAVLPLGSRAHTHWTRGLELIDETRVHAAAEELHRGLEASEVEQDALAASEALRRLATIAEDAGRHADALELLSQASSAAAPAARADATLELELRTVRSILRGGDAPEARARLERVAAALTEPDARSLDTLLLAGDLFVELGETQRARDAYRAAAELPDGDPTGKQRVDAYRKLAELLRDAGETEEAFAILHRALLDT